MGCDSGVGSGSGEGEAWVVILGISVGGCGFRLYVEYAGFILPRVGRCGVWCGCISRGLVCGVVHMCGGYWVVVCICASCTLCVEGSDQIVVT